MVATGKILTIAEIIEGGESLVDASVRTWGM